MMRYRGRHRATRHSLRVVDIKPSYRQPGSFQPGQLGTYAALNRYWRHVAAVTA